MGGGGGGGGGGVGGILKNSIVCKSKKSPTKFFAGMKKIVCRKMTPEKSVFTDNDTEKKIVCLGTIFIPQLPKKIMVRPIDRQDTAAYSVF